MPSTKGNLSKHLSMVLLIMRYWHLLDLILFFPQLAAALKGLFYQVHSARITISTKAPCVALARCQTWLHLVSFHHQKSPDMVINHGLTDRALNCLEMKCHISIQGTPGRMWNLFHLCGIKKWSTLGEWINPNFRFIKVSLLCLIKSVLKPPNPKLKT